MAEHFSRSWTRNHHHFRKRRHKKRYYAVSKGWETGIFTDPDRYTAAIYEFIDPRARKFSTYEEARQWLRFTSLQEEEMKALLPKPDIRDVSCAIKKHLAAINPRKILALDIEYTGFTADAEILQVSLINGAGEILCNEYFKPKHLTSWEDSIPIHHITPEMVADKPSFSSYARRLSRYFAVAESIIGYSTMQDIALLHKYGTAAPSKAIYLDVGEAYSYVHATETVPRTYAKLRDCASHYGYTDTGWHDSLCDAQATLFCFRAMLYDDKALFRLHTFHPHVKKKNSCT